MDDVVFGYLSFGPSQLLPNILGTINFKIPLKTFKKRRNDTHCQQRELQHNMFSGRI